MIASQVARIACVTLIALAAPLFAHGEDYSWRIYDLRDLEALMPAAAGDAAPGAVAPAAFASPPDTPTESLAMLYATTPPTTPVAPPAPPPGPASPSRTLMAMLSTPVNMESVTLSPGIFVVGATPEQHALLTQLLEQVRALYAERYVVELITYSVAHNVAPRIAQPAQPESIVSRLQLVVARRAVTPVVALQEQSYVANLDPRLAESVYAYSTTIASVPTGLDGRLSVGAGRAEDESTTLELHGVALNSFLDKSAGPDGAEGASWRVELPRTMRRSIETNVRVKLGQPTVVAVVPGFEPGTTLVVAATVERLAD